MKKRYADGFVPVASPLKKSRSYHPWDDVDTRDLGFYTRALPDLPPEIWLKIFHHSREPAMIHVCRTFRTMLPNYVQYTTCLLGMAFGTRQPGNPLHERHASLWPLAGRKGIDWTNEERDELQREVASSRWLSLKILQDLQAKLLSTFMLQCVTSNPAIKLTSRQKASIGNLPERLRDSNGGSDDFRGQSFNCSQRLVLHIREDMVLVEKTDHNSFHGMDMWAVRYIPDCLLVGKNMLERRRFIQVLLRAAALAMDDPLDSYWSTTPADSFSRLNGAACRLPRGLNCNAKLLKTQIYAAITERYITRSYEAPSSILPQWLTISIACDWNVAIEPEMLKAAIGKEDSVTLRMLLSPAMIMEDFGIPPRLTWTIVDVQEIYRVIQTDPDQICCVRVLQKFMDNRKGKSVQRT